MMVYNISHDEMTNLNIPKTDIIVIQKVRGYNTEQGKLSCSFTPMIRIDIPVFLKYHHNTVYIIIFCMYV